MAIPANAPTDELQIGEEKEDEAYVEYDIATYPSDYTIDVLLQMKERDDIVIPPFQRKYVWTMDQASLLVESFLLGLPVPPLFLYINEENKSEVIDGQQRLMSMMYFIEGYFGEPDAKGKRQTFRLTGLSERSPFRYKTFKELEDRHQRKLNTSVLRAINIRQLSPHGASTSVFHIFERLNTGGTSLKPQEIRNAVFRGNIVDALKKLNATPEWRKILGITVADKFQRDVELILRLFSLYETWESYEKPMKEHLNRAMKGNKNFNDQRATSFVSRFPVCLNVVVKALGERPFRPSRVINASVLEAVMVTLLENPTITPQQLERNYEILLEDQDFLKVIRGATTDTKVVKDRLSLARKMLMQ